MMEMKTYVKIAVCFVLFCMVAALPFFLVSTAEAQQNKGVIKIGRIGTATGTLKVEYDACTIPVKMFFEDKNWQVAGRKIELIEEDSGGNATVGLTKIHKLVEKDKVAAILGPNFSSVMYAARDYLHQQNVPTLFYGGAARLSRDKHSPALFRVCPSGYQYTYETAKWAVRKGYKRAIFIGSDYSSPHEAGRGAAGGFKDAGGQVVAEFWPAFNTMDFAPYITQIKSKLGQADIVFAALWGGEGIRFVTQWANMA